MSKNSSGSGKGNKKWLLIGAIAVGAWMLMGGRKVTAGDGMATLQPVDVKGGETVKAASYRILSERRNLRYVQATGVIGGEMTFVPDKDGTFTRNIIQEGESLWAELA